MAQILANPSGLSGYSAHKGGNGQLTGLGAYVTALLEKWSDYSERLKARRELRSMSDRDLADMGLSRCDIERVVEGKFVRGE